ncbi:hypothetical protein NEOLEDRAFT_1072414 [Neolentinus lepideus HHB14362 ss-1]|uniref:Uncharacterized protein n=1 Tax=Neolentinus lepideus HHB14362 ss-1 TaxID=1314782 RepID=A0A165Q8G1_9AGAM|nr:hypothetical protein NEOLEDRAFT_1072414 [Neolentinus lepideus HHB14362 ss-1]
MKMHHYVRSLALDVRRKTKFLHSSIKQILQSTHAAIRNKATNKVAQSNGAICKVDKKVVLFLGTHAFHLVLSCKPEVYSRLVKLLAFELSLPKNRILQSRYRSVLAEGQATVTQLSF